MKSVVIQGPPTEPWCGGAGPSGLRAARDCAEYHVHVTSGTETQLVASAEVWAAHIPAQPDGVDAVVPLDAPERVYRRTHDEWMGDLWADRFSAGVPWDELMHMWVRGVRRYEPPPPQPCPMCTNTAGGGHSADLCDDHRARFEAWLVHEYPDG